VNSSTPSGVGASRLLLLDVDDIIVVVIADCIPS